jgi:hypothetical protein
MLPTYFPDQPFGAISIYSSGKRSFAGYDAESGVSSVVNYEENLEVLICNTIATDNMVEPVFAQQPVRRG